MTSYQFYNKDESVLSGHYSLNNNLTDENKVLWFLSSQKEKKNSTALPVCAASAWGGVCRAAPKPGGVL